MSKRLFVRRVDADALHPSGQQHLVDVPDEPVEVGVRHGRSGSQRGVAVGRAHRDETVVASHEIGPDDHPGVVVLEALRRVDATHLSEAGGIGRLA